VAAELGGVDFPGSACVVLALSFCGAGALCTVILAMGNANKPATSSIEREIETIAVSFWLSPHTYTTMSVKRPKPCLVAHHHAESIVRLDLALLSPISRATANA
jgi:hypothetical protein